MVKDLSEKGITPRKSLTLSFDFNSIPREMIRHFIRGYWDGDGTLTWGNKEHTYPEIGVISTEDFLLGILKFLKLEASIRINSNNFGNSITKKFQLYSHKAFIACYKLYENSNIYL